jgi:hypothetical protein
VTLTAAHPDVRISYWETNSVSQFWAVGVGVTATLPISMLSKLASAPASKFSPFGWLSSVANQRISQIVYNMLGCFIF